MAKINLLPWRQELRKRRQQEFLAINMTVAVVGLILVVFFHLMMSTRLSDQAERKAFIKSEIDVLDGQIKEIDELQKRKDDLLARMKVIQDLQGRRPTVVHVFDDMVRAVPDKLYLTNFERTGDKFKIEGIADSNNQISSFLRNLNASPWFKNPVLEKVEVDDSKTQSAKPIGQTGVKVDKSLQKNHFTLSVDLESPEPAPGTDKQGVTKTNKEAGK